MLKKPAPHIVSMVVYDCFSNQRFGGNIGGIVLDAQALDAAQLQSIAREINAPVTGFITEKAATTSRRGSFMPSAEIAMCGHVTVGLFTHLFRNEPGIQGESVNYRMKVQAGGISVRVEANADDLPNVMMELSKPTVSSCNVDKDALAQALGVSSLSVSQNAPREKGNAGLDHLFVHFDSLEQVENLKPNFGLLRELSQKIGVQKVACFSMQTSQAENTLHIRDFCPAVGADEVPASGTTNGALVGYLLKNGLIPMESQSIQAEQGTEIGRPSLIRSTIGISDGQITSLHVGGQAVASIHGTVELG